MKPLPPISVTSLPFNALLFAMAEMLSSIRL
jgi:hypothetical protein